MNYTIKVNKVYFVLLLGGKALKLEKMGMRTIKSGIAVMLCVLLGSSLLENVAFAAIACVVSMQNTVKGSLKQGLGRVNGTAIGGIIGYIFLVLSPGNPILAGLGVMIIIYIHNILGLKSIIVSCMTFFIIHLGRVEGSAALYSISRVIDTSVGVVIGVLINYLIVRPDYLDSTINEIKKVEKTAIKLLEIKIIKKENIYIEKLTKQVKKLENVYSKLIEELDYSKNTIDIEALDKTVSTCKEICIHMESIELLSKKLYLNERNYNSLKEIYSGRKLNWDIDEDKSPVFNYHLEKIISEMEELKLLKK